MAILSVNAGSSTLKFALYPVDASGAVAAALITGSIEGLEQGGTAQLTYQTAATSGADGDALARRPGPYAESIDVGAHDDPFVPALAVVQQLLHEQLKGQSLQAIAHRVVHGGVWYRQAVVVQEQVMSRLETLHALAPLHQPHNLDGIRSLQRVFPGVPQIACFDTAFHADLPEQEYLFALPKRLSGQGIRRYGFHGLSYQFLQTQLRHLSARSEEKVVMAHLGNGASLCAMQAGRSCATTMGFSALEGLMMGTRSGSLDPGVLLHLLGQGLSPRDLGCLLYKESGLLGVSGVAADMRKLRASSEPDAKRAIDLFTHRVVREAGAMTACLQGLDLLAFTGGIGEHDAILRQEVCARLGYLGVDLDLPKNEQADGSTAVRLDTAQSQVEVWLVPTDEGRMAAQSAAEILQRTPV